MSPLPFTVKMLPEHGPFPPYYIQEETERRVNYGAGSPECKGKDRMRERMAAAASGGNLLS